jgi:hypothetical protein
VARLLTNRGIAELPSVSVRNGPNSMCSRFAVNGARPVCYEPTDDPTAVGAQLDLNFA